MTNVVQIGDLRITRTERQRFSGCQHKNFTVDPNGDIVTCDDCDKQITSHWALVMLIEEWQREIGKLQRGQAAHAAALAKSVGLKAAQKVEEAWRSRTMVPTCPHCNEAIFPGDNFGGSAINREMALRRRVVAQADAQTAPQRTVEHAAVEEVTP